MKLLKEVKDMVFDTQNVYGEEMEEHLKNLLEQDLQLKVIFMAILINVNAMTQNLIGFLKA